MPAIGQFLALLEAVSRRDWKRVEEVGRRVAEEERKKKHFTAAHQVLQAVDVVVSGSGFDRIGTLSSPSSAPTALPPDLLHASPLDQAIVRPVLPGALEREVSEFVTEWQHAPRLAERGLKPRHTVLVQGPPGCGKTLLAAYLASQLKLRLYTVRFDTLISSFLGETGGNIRKVFEFLGANRCAILIDEIDAIAKLRDDRNELGELKRIVISLLQNLDLSNSSSLLIAATNHPHMLDPAIWRRFEVVWELPAPTPEGRVKLFERFVEGKFSTEIARLMREITEGMSGADIERVCANTTRRMMLDPSLSIDEAILVSTLEFLKRTAVITSDTKSIEDRLIRTALHLRSMKPKAYSFHDLERISGIPHSTLHHRHAGASR